jgi:hypothetical protein
MKQTRVQFFAFAFSVFAGLSVFAGDSDTKYPDYRFAGYAGLEIGQIVNGSYYWNNTNSPTAIEKAWQERFLYQFINDVTITDHLRMALNIEGQISFSYPQKLSPAESQTARYLFYPERAEAMYSLGDPVKPFLQFGLGYFPYKFNPDAVNLGEFIFRTGTYPVYLISNFNHCYGKLLGLRTTFTPFESLKLDLLFTSNTQMFPTQDYSLSFLGHYSFFKALDFGAGISLDHLISIDGKLTKGESFQDGLYQPKPNDTAHSYYSFAGTKPAVSLAFDPKPLLPSSIAHLLGKNDGRIYGEVCVSGWENRKNYDTTIDPYKDYYTDRTDRTLAMVGFTVPTFKVFDVLSVEFEHYPNKYPNSWRQVFDENIAIPYIGDSRARLPWKVSVYAKRSIGKTFFILCQIARDHMRPTFPDLKNMEREDVLNGIDDWWWTASLNFSM